MRNPATMPWQDRISEANERIERIGGKGFSNRSNMVLALQKKEIFAAAQIPGTVAMLEGGGAAPLNLLIETQNGWMVRVTFSKGEAHALAELLLNSIGAE